MRISPVIMWFAACAMAIRPEEHWRSTVWPGISTGRPAASDAKRPILLPAVPALNTVPIMTSSISVGSTRARSTACVMAWPINVGDLILFRAPRKARPIGVRAVETMAAFFMRRPESFNQLKSIYKACELIRDYPLGVSRLGVIISLCYGLVMNPLMNELPEIVHALGEGCAATPK